MSDIVRAYYDGAVLEEWDRLAKPYRRFELLSTLQLIEDFFPSSGRIADIGSGPGRYSVELLQRGYAVTLVDLSEANTRFAREKLSEHSLVPEDVFCADARSLSMLESSSFDGALELGPMYHIIEAAERKRALAELHRILKPGAPAIVGFINPWGVLRGGLTEFPGAYSDASLIRQLLETCVQAGEQKAFTESAFLTPPEALMELRSAGFVVECRAGVEGFASGARDQITDMAQNDPAAYAVVGHLVPETSTHPAFRDCTEHLHVVVRKIP
ncbi:methyltransferase domain-containing protein [Candidatus Bipolaricaulota bacterium]|nr:methyltransferase domain-containing protein [Candidatus Bipolaricaulota bacterium]